MPRLFPFTGDDDLLGKLISIVLFGIMVLAILSQVMGKTGTGFEFKVPTVGGVVLLFNILIVGAAVWLGFSIISRKKQVERKDMVLIVVAVAVLYFVFNKLNPDGLKMMSMQLMSAIGIG